MQTHQNNQCIFLKHAEVQIYNVQSWSARHEKAFQNCSNLLSVVEIDTVTDWKQLGEERVCFSLHSIIKGIQDRSSRQKPQSRVQKGALLTHLLPLTCFSTSLIHLRLTYPGMAPPTVSQTLLYLLENKKIPCRHPRRSFCWRQFPKWGSFPMCVNLTIDTNRHYWTHWLSTF